MVEPLIVLGAGGFGRETIETVGAINLAAPRPKWDLVGVADDSPSEINLGRLATQGIPYLGTTEELIASGMRPHYVVGIGSPLVRHSLADRMDGLGFNAATLIHPDATIGSQCTLGDGTVVLAGARLTTNIRVGRHVHLNPNTTIGHDTLLEDFVSMNPASSVSGDCLIRAGALIGVGAVVLNRLTVGLGALIGGCACVVKNVEDGAVMIGVPAVPIQSRPEKGS